MNGGRQMWQRAVQTKWVASSLSRIHAGKCDDSPGRTVAGFGINVKRKHDCSRSTRVTCVRAVARAGRCVKVVTTPIKEAVCKNLKVKNLKAWLTNSQMFIACHLCYLLVTKQTALITQCKHGRLVQKMWAICTLDCNCSGSKTNKQKKGLLPQTQQAWKKAERKQVLWQREIFTAGVTVPSSPNSHGLYDHPEVWRHRFYDYRQHQGDAKRFTRQTALIFRNWMRLSLR